MLEFAKPFPLTSKAIDASRCDKLKSSYSEYVINITYHQQLAVYALHNCIQAMGDYNFMIMDDGKKIKFTKIPEISMVMHGDIVVRELSSAIDSALSLTNFVAKLGISPRHVDWKLSTKCEMRNKLRRMGQDTARLVDSIDAVYKSIGYKLMNDYRNWVTHRGAPRLFSMIPFDQPMLIPTEVAWDVPASSDDQHNIGLHARQILYDNLKVACHRFRAPVENVYTKTFTPADEKIVLGGQVIGSNAGTIHMKNVRFSIGNMMDDAIKYQENNPKWLGEESIEIAGEKITVYNLTDYRQALDHASDFYYCTVTGMWDHELASCTNRTATE